MRVIDSAGKQIGILSREQALVAAKEENLDLVQITANVDPVVCRITDYGKFLFDQKKNEQMLRSIRLRRILKR